MTHSFCGVKEQNRKRNSKGILSFSEKTNGQRLQVLAEFLNFIGATEDQTVYAFLSDNESRRLKRSGFEIYWCSVLVFNKFTLLMEYRYEKISGYIIKSVRVNTRVLEAYNSKTGIL